MNKIYGKTGEWMLVSDKDLPRFLEDGYSEKKPEVKKPEVKKEEVKKPEVKKDKK